MTLLWREKPSGCIEVIQTHLYPHGNSCSLGYILLFFFLTAFLYTHILKSIFFFCKGYGNVRSDMEGLKGVQCQHIWGSLVMTRDPQMEAAEIQRSILFAQAERADGMRGA